MTSTSRTEPRVTEPAVTRQPIPGALVAGIGGPLMLAITNAIVNFTPGWSTAQNYQDLLAVIRTHPLAAQLTVALGLLVPVLLVPGIWAVTAVLRSRSRWLAAVGGWLMSTGYVLSILLSTDTMTMLALAETPGDPAVWVDAVQNHTPFVVTLATIAFGVGALLGGLILGIVMVRQRDVIPAWAGWALIASEPVRVIGLMFGIAVGPPLASLLIMVGFAGALLAAHRRAS